MPVAKNICAKDRSPITMSHEKFWAWAHRRAGRVNFVARACRGRGHGEVFSSPDFGVPGALDRATRSVTIPPDTLAPGIIYSLNLEITRLASTNLACYPGGEGVTGTFSSTSIDLTTIVLPELRLLSGPSNGQISLSVQADPGMTIVL